MSLNHHIIRKTLRAGLLGLAAGLTLMTNYAFADGYSASFQNADINEFVNTVSANLGRTIILDPGVRGKVSVRSYETLNKDEYYRFFLSVLQVYGFTAVETENNTLKVIPAKNARTEAVPVLDPTNQPSDQTITWVLPVNNVPARELAPLLRQLNDSYGNVVHYEPSNVLLFTGRAGNLERLSDIVRRVDNAGKHNVEVLNMQYASATEMERILKAIYAPNNSEAVIVAEERSNKLLVSATPAMLNRIRALALQLDAEQAASGNTRVFYLRYSRADELKPVLDSVAQSIQKGATTGNAKTASKSSGFSIEAHEPTNALVITAQPDMMGTLDDVIKRLDIRRTQVLVEAIIAEISESDGAHLSFQLASQEGGIIQFNDGSSVPIGELVMGLKEAEDTKGSTIINENGQTIQNPDQPGDYDSLTSTLAKLNGAGLAITSGNWMALFQAINSSSESNILATPSLMTLDNHEASFIVGDEVPTITGSTSGSNNDNPYQTVERREVGIKLTVKPQINEGNAVRLDIEQEVSQINGQTSVDVTFATRQVQTSVMVGSGDTVVIGGLLNEDVQESESKVPLLADIPFLGRLFRSSTSSVSKSNLMVFIRPTIIRDDSVINAVSASKYGLIRAEQLSRQNQGVLLMPEKKTPLLEEFPEKTPSSQDLMDHTKKVLEEKSEQEEDFVRTRGDNGNA